jgi:hypothetical protein
MAQVNTTVGMPHSWYVQLDDAAENRGIAYAELVRQLVSTHPDSPLDDTPELVEQ